ncbi:MAG: hypothetical protein LBB80_04690 [Treponema sp.]|nr:hypothetical protein [Treponema sp.]
MDICIFDDPTSGLDREGLLRVPVCFRKMVGMDKTIFIITHDNELIWDGTHGEGERAGPGKVQFMSCKGIAWLLGSSEASGFSSQEAWFIL